MIATIVTFIVLFLTVLLLLSYSIEDSSYILYDYVSLSYRTSVLYDRARLAIPISYCPMHCHIATVP